MPPVEPTNPEAPVDPNVEVVRIDIEAEVHRLCDRQGISHLRLKDRLDLSRFDYYRASVMSFYQGKDEGTRETYVSVGVTVAYAHRVLLVGLIVWVLLIIAVIGIRYL